jgi:hypothetical protein
MTPDKAVALALLIPSGISAAFIAVAAVTANVRHPKTPTPTRPAGPSPRAGAGPTCVACGRPAVKAVRAGYDTWAFCLRCREEVNALTGRTS